MSKKPTYMGDYQPLNVMNTLLLGKRGAVASPGQSPDDLSVRAPGPYSAEFIYIRPLFRLINVYLAHISQD